MKTILMTTAIVATAAMPAFAQAQSQDGSGAMDSDAFVQSATDMSAGLAASNLMGQRIYATASLPSADAQTADPAEDWDDIGEVGDILLTRDGSVEAVVLDVGGFLGIGERHVAIRMDQIELVNDADSDGDFFLVVNADRSAIEDAPEFDVSAVGAWAEATVEQAAAAAGDAAEETGQAIEGAVEEGAQMADMSELARPDVQREGWTTASADDLTSEELTGTRLYDTSDEMIGEVSKLILDADGKIDQAVLDIGGFLGLGEHSVAVAMDRLQISRAEETGDLRIYVDAERSELEAMPEYDEDS